MSKAKQPNTFTDQIAEFLTPSGGHAGWGIHIGQGQVLTVSHVVNAAIGIDPNSRRSKNGKPVDMRLPFIVGSPELTGRILRWSSPADADVALVQIPTTVTGDEGALLDPTFVVEAGRSVRIYGPTIDPGNAKSGAWAEATTMLPVHSGTWQIDQAATANYLIEAGCSGAPVWDGDRLVGLIWGGSKGNRSARMIGLATLGRFRAHPATNRGTPAWRMRHVLGDTLKSLLKDLVAKEESGILDEQCNTVKVALGQLVVQLSDLDEGMQFNSPPFTAARAVQQTYELWNGPRNATDPAAPVKRRALLADLLKQRLDLSKLALTAYQTTLFDDRLGADADDIVRAFQPIGDLAAEDGKPVFSNVERSLRRYKSGVRKGR